MTAFRSHRLELGWLLLLQLFWIGPCCVVWFGSLAAIEARAQEQRHRRAIAHGRIVADPSEAMFFARSGNLRNHNHDSADPSLLCGATLIHNDILLTAAHCQGSFNYGVLLYDPETNDYTREATVDLQIRYPGFNGMDMNNDILLLRLSSNPGLPIATLNSDDSVPAAAAAANTILRALGFGSTGSDGAPSEALREGYLRSIDNDDCTEWIRYLMDDPSLPQIRDDVLCGDAHFPGHGMGSSICNGDSGGPLLVAASPFAPSEASPLVVGVSSWSFGCGEGDGDSATPNGFARVSVFYDWIQEQICSHSRVIAADRDCPVGTFPPSPDPNAVLVFLFFDHDYYPEDTLVRVLSKTKNHGTDGSSSNDANDIDHVVFVGPQYIPERESSGTSVLYLVPGNYTLEIWDSAGNGLSPGSSGSDKRGSWRLVALYDHPNENTETELASGGANFLELKVVDFVVEASATQSGPASSKATETSTGAPIGIQSTIPSTTPSTTQSPMPSIMPSVILSATPSTTQTTTFSILPSTDPPVKQATTKPPTSFPTVFSTRPSVRQPAVPSKIPSTRPSMEPSATPSSSSSSSSLMSETIRIKHAVLPQPSPECMEERSREEQSLGPGIVCNCAREEEDQHPVSLAWTVRCVDTHRNDAVCAATNQRCGTAVESDLVCCGNRRCSNGRCRWVPQVGDERLNPRISGINNHDRLRMGTLRGVDHGS